MHVNVMPMSKAYCFHTFNLLEYHYDVIKLQVLHVCACVRMCVYMHSKYMINSRQNTIDLACN